MRNTIRTTSWSDEELKLLCEPDSHRIHFDGYEWIWQQGISGIWTRQTLKEFNDYAHAYSFLVYNLASWKKEYDQRESKRRTKELRKIKSIERKASKIQSIVSSGSSTQSRVKDLLKLLPDLSNKDLANMLGVTCSLISKYRPAN